MMPANQFKIAAMVVVLAVATVVSVWLTYDDLVVIPRARPLVVDHFKDPGSAQFRLERIGKFGWVCGEVNSKNSYGAYTGFERYISGAKPGTIYLESVGAIGKPDLSHFPNILADDAEVQKVVEKLYADMPELTRDDEPTSEPKVHFKEIWTAVCA